MPRKPKYQYDEKTLKQVYSLSAAGCSIETIAGCIKRDKRMFEMDLKKNDKLRYALDEGQAAGIGSVTQNLFKKASAKDAGTDVMFRWLEYRASRNWRKTERVEHTGANGGPIAYTDETPEQAEERRKRVRAKLDKLASKRQGN